MKKGGDLPRLFIDRRSGRYANMRIVGLRKEDEENATEEGGAGAQEVKFSIRKIDGKDIVVIDTDQDIFEGVDKADLGKVVRSYMKERYRGSSIDGKNFTAQSEKEYTSSRDSQRLYNQGNGVYEAKMRASTELENIILTGELIG